MAWRYQELIKVRWKDLFLTSLEINGEVVFDSMKHEHSRRLGVLYEIWVHQSKGHWQKKTCLPCKDCQFASKCVVEVIIKLSTSPKVLLCSADIIVKKCFTIKCKYFGKK